MLKTITDSRDKAFQVVVSSENRSSLVPGGEMQGQPGRAGEDTVEIWTCGASNLTKSMAKLSASKASSS